MWSRVGVLLILCGLVVVGTLLGIVGCGGRPPAVSTGPGSSSPVPTTAIPQPAPPEITSAPAVEPPPIESAASTVLGGLAANQVLAWQRLGGLAGFCDRLIVYADGRAVATSCEKQLSVERGSLILSNDRKSQLNGWLRALKPFDRQEVDPATADAMTVQLAFAGTGDQEATSSDWATLQGFAAMLFEEAVRLGEPSAVPEPVQTESASEVTM